MHARESPYRHLQNEGVVYRAGWQTDCQPEGGIMPHGIGIVMIAPALSTEQNARAKQIGQIMDNILLATRVSQLRYHSLNDPAAVEDLAQGYSAGIPWSAAPPDFRCEAIG